MNHLTSQFLGKTNNVMDLQEIINRKGDSDLTNGEIKTLAAFVIQNERLNADAKYLEIGVFAGGTTKFMIDSTQTTKFTGIDLFEDFIISQENTHVSGTFRRDDVQTFLGERAKLLKGSSADLLKELKHQGKKFDMCFIDGNHSYAATKEDFELSTHILNPNGQIAFHNCSAHMEPDWIYIRDDGGPWRFTTELIGSSEWQKLADVDRLRVFGRRSHAR